MKYTLLTPNEQRYMLQDGIFKEDVEAAKDVWVVIDYLTPRYRRFTANWYKMVARLTEKEER